MFNANTDISYMLSTNIYPRGRADPWGGGGGGVPGPALGG